VVIEGLYKVLTSLIAGFFNLFPTLPSLSGAAANIASALATISAKASQFGAWIPLGQVGNALGLVLAALTASLLIKGVRIVISLFTGGGGSAA